MCKWWNRFGNTWRAERLGQRPNKGDHLLNIPCLGDTGASGPVRLSVGAGGECGVSLRSSLWSWNMDLLRLHVVVSQLLTKANLVSQCYGYHILNVLLGSSHPWGNFMKFHSFGCFLGGQVDGCEVPIWTPRRRTGWQFWLVNVQHASAICPREDLHLSDRQLDPGRQMGEDDEIRGQVCEGLRSTK